MLLVTSIQGGMEFAILALDRMPKRNRADEEGVE
jgi:hypothetical protein